MARPKTKEELINLSNANYEKLNDIIAKLSEIEFNTDFDFSKDERKEAHWNRDKNIRDVLIHLYEWHILAIDWVNKNMDGEKTSFLPKPYTFKNYAEMNVKFWENHQDTSYEKADEMLKNSHDEIMKIIDEFTDEELFIKKHFDWTGTTSVGSYLISATSSHYDWAIKKIKEHKRKFK